MALPANISTRWVEGQFLTNVTDGPDPDQKPDGIAAQGTVTFVAGVEYLPNPTAEPNPATMLMIPRVAVLDDAGYICTPVRGTLTPAYRGIMLECSDDPDGSVTGWTWNATYTFMPVDGVTPVIKPHSFPLPAAEDALDLTKVVKVPSSAGIGKEQAEVLAASAQAAAVRAAADAAKAMAAAEEALGAAVATDDNISSLVGKEGTKTKAAVVRQVEVAAASKLDADEAASTYQSIDGLDAVAAAKVNAENSSLRRAVDARAQAAASSKLDATQAADTFQTITDARRSTNELTAAVTEALKLAETVPPNRWDETVSKLDMRTDQPLVIAQCSDSTGYRADQFFELGWKDLVSRLWAERPARIKRWDMTTSTYSAWEVWQDGGTNTPIVNGTAYWDTFSIDRTSVVGASPQVGGAYAKHAEQDDTFFTVSGGRLRRGNPTDGVTLATLRSAIAPREDHNWRIAGIIRLPEGAKGQTEIMMTVTSESVDRVVLNIGANGNATLTTMWNGDATTVTALGTLTGAVAYGVDMPFALSLTGTTIGAGLNGVARTATIPEAMAEKFASPTLTRLVLRSSMAGTEWDEIKVTGRTFVRNPTDTPGIDFYNGGASGTTPDYHRARLATMYPVPVDLLIMNHMHNFPESMTNNECLAVIQAFVDELTALHGKRPGVIVNSQNPRFGTHAKPVHEGRIVALRDYAHKQGWGYIPSYEAFAELADRGRSLLVDDLHPAIGTGRFLQRDVFVDTIMELSRRRAART